MAILRKYIGNDQVAGEKVLLDNDQALRAKSSTGVSESLLKLDTANVLQLLKLPRVSLDPTHGSDLVRLSYLESSVNSAKAELGLDIDQVENRLIAEEIRAQAEEARIEGLVESEEQRALAAEAALGIRIDGEISRATAKEAEIEASVATKIPLSYIGAQNGVAPLGGDSKIPAQYLPAVAVTDVFVVTTIAQRDALVPASVQTGDVVKVTEAVTSASGTKLPRTYIYDGSQFVELNTESDVDSVNGFVGHVVLNTSHIAEQGDFRYYTPAREQMAKDYADAAVAVEQQARMAEDALIRQKFAAEDALIRQEFAAADQVILQESKDYTDQQVLIESQAREEEDLTFLKHDGSRAMTGNLDMSDFDINNISELTGFSGAAIDVGSELSMQGHKISGLADPTDAQDAATRAYVDMQVTDGITDLLGQPNGIATLDSQGKLTFSQIPAIAITDVFVVQTIAARDALTVEEGDVAKVIEGELSSDGVWKPRTFIYAVDNASEIGSWVEITSEGDVMSVAGRTGHISLDTGDVAEKIDGPLYFTEFRAKSAAVIDSIMGGEHDKAPSVFAAKAYIDQEITSARSYTDSQLDLLTVSMPEYFAVELSAQDISNGYIDLPFVPSIAPVVVRQGLVGRYGPNSAKRDFSFEGLRITFINEWAVGGLSQIEQGDLVEVRYQKSVTPYLN